MTEPEQPVVAVPLRVGHLTVRNVIETYARRLAEAYPDLTPDIIGERDEILAALAVEAVRPETDIDESLDAAWNEAEAALPKGWELSVEGKSGHFVSATAHNLRDATEHPTESADTPAAALRSLAKRLRATPLAERPE